MECNFVILKLIPLVLQYGSRLERWEYCDNIWNKEDYVMVRKCKPNIMAASSYKHHGSSGACYAFGNKADYRMIEGVSVGTFTNVRVKNEMKQKAVDHESEVM